MPYVVVAAPTRASRLALAASRWAELVRVDSALAPAVELQRRLVHHLLDLLDRLERTSVPRLSLPPRYLAAKLRRGMPAVAGEPVPLPVAELIPVLLAVCRTLAAGGAGDPANHVIAAIREDRIDAGSLLSASFARNRHAIQTGAVQHSLSPDLLWLAAELAVSPFVHVLQQAVARPAADPDLATALDTWTHGYCPFCGSWPALAEAVDGTAVLRCSFCALAWTRPAGSCTYCEQATIVVESGREWPAGARMQTCSACGGYLKVVESDQLTPFPLLAISDLQTMELDVAAVERGVHRPDVREFMTAR
jgi:FdhE protein